MNYEIKRESIENTGNKSKKNGIKKLQSEKSRRTALWDHVVAKAGMHKE